MVKWLNLHYIFLSEEFLSPSCGVLTSDLFSIRDTDRSSARTLSFASFNAVSARNALSSAAWARSSVSLKKKIIKSYFQLVIKVFIKIDNSFRGEFSSYV